MHIHSGTICNSPKVQTTKCPSVEWMDKQIVLCVHVKFVFFTHKKELNTDTCYNVDKLQKHAKWKKPQKAAYCMIPFIEKVLWVDGAVITPHHECTNATGLLAFEWLILCCVNITSLNVYDSKKRISEWVLKFLILVKLSFYLLFFVNFSGLYHVRWCISPWPGPVIYLLLYSL